MYNHNELEKKWLKYWEENQTYKFKDELDKKKFYILDMCVYPSGKGLHVGHPKGFTGTDIVSRYKTLNGFNVLHPMGWDAFGLPAEQYALQTGNHPAEFTQINIEKFKQQLKRIGLNYDYSKDIDTTDPNFYQWTQWIFIQLYKNGLAEIRDIDVNWCEGLGTALANEEVLIDKDGNRVSERGNFPVTRRKMRQWVLKITEYADKLIEGLDEIDWPKSLKSLQTNWIGKMVGWEINFNVANSDNKIKIFTTRPDTIFGVSFIAISPTHPLIDKLTTSDNSKLVKEYIEKCQNLSDRELKINKTKTGIFIGSHCLNPITNEQIPIYVSSFVLNEVGTGAIMGVPAHNENDYEFAQFANLPIKQVIEGQPLPFENDGKHINSDFLNGLYNNEAIEKIVKKLEENNNAKRNVSYKLRDWIFSRQRYWGEPFPVLFDENFNIVIENNLPLLLPELKEFKPSGNGESPLKNAKDWLNVTIDGKKYLRDTNTMPQWAGSCWYYIGYILKNNDDNSYVPLNSDEAKTRLKRWLPVDVYVGGQEHAVLHLLYARFWHRFLYDIGVVPTKEPFFKMINQGIILGPNGEKMSKSKGNIISVDDVVDAYGADALRMYEMFMGPFTSSMPWNDNALDGVRKWLDRVYRLYFCYKDNDFKVENKISEASNELVVSYNKMLKKVGEHIDNYQFNTAISEMMIFINSVYKLKEFNIEIMKNFTIILWCFAPFLGEELNQLLQPNSSSVNFMSWPKYDPNKVIEQIVRIPVVINKKPRDIIEVEINTNEEELLKRALESEKVQKFINGSQIKNKVIVKNKIVSLEI
ncbi:MAG: leucine--tRNA ligase [Ureaplasma sp.]|nr:leucine--tRNA ligase [Ureaplasma sp.]MDE7221876.1 leucine--tRNA ligase [Ureaplasma sp.]